MNYSMKPSFIITTASGKGGVGKTLSTVNIAEKLVQMDYRVAVIDADLGLSNCASMVNESVPATLIDVKHGKCYLENIFQKTSGGITLVTGADEPNLETTNIKSIYPLLDETIRSLRHDHDFIFIDSPAGTSDISLWALDRADLGMLILVDEPTVISDVYRFCKFVLEIDPSYPFGLVVNLAENEDASKQVVERFNSITGHFLGREFPFLGQIPMSEEIRQSVSRQVPVIRSTRDTHISKEIEFIASTLVGFSEERPASISINS